MKRLHHNVYGLPSRIFRVICALGISLWVFFFLDVQLRHLSPLIHGVLFVSAILIPVAATLLFNILESKKNVIPYSRKDGFEFLGLHNLKESVLENRHDVLPRDEEITYIHRVLEETVFPQTSVKQALCITGPSGCGKSTILSFFRQVYKEEYSIFDFSGNYKEFHGHMVSLFGTNIDQKISEMACRGKVVFILDQFERFFFLPEKEQKSIREIIQCLCRKNTGIILSLREEYLAEFMKRFDMNNLLSPDDESSVIPRGILRQMISIIEKNPGNRSASSIFIRPSKTVVWEYHRIINNAAVHLDTAEKGSGHVILEEMAATLFYCRNQNEMSSQMQGVNSHASILESKCRLLFGEEGLSFFRKHEREPLIEQQIIFHMAEFNQKVYSYPDEELRSFFQKDNNEILGQYFDIQLAACDSYFQASRLLYLLSQARINHLSISTRDVENCLFPNLFDRKGHERLMRIIGQLETMQLIRKNTEGSTLEYEIAHDFIASSYLEYCSTNMNRGMKSALDLYISEYMDEDRSIFLHEKTSHRQAVYGQRYYPIATSVSICFMCIAFFTERFVFNPWTSIWGGFNPYGSYCPALPLFITAISVIYLCFIYDKIVKYYRGKKTKVCRIIYLFLMLLAVAAVFAYPHFLFFDSIDLAVAAINIGLLLNHDYQQTCRRELTMYGLKSCLIGLVFAFGHVFFYIFNSNFDDYLILTEYVMFTFLVAYAFISHMTQEFLFARMADASSEKL